MGKATFAWPLLLLGASFTASALTFAHAVRFTVPAQPEPLGAVPVLVRLQEGAGGFSYADMAHPETGADVAFVGLDNALLPFEVEAWNPAGESAIWVKVPVTTSGASFRLLYGDASVAGRKEGAVFGDYLGAWHFQGWTPEGNAIADASGHGRLLRAPASFATSGTCATNHAVAGEAVLNQSVKMTGGTTKMGFLSEPFAETGDAANELVGTDFTLSGWFCYVGYDEAKTFAATAYFGTERAGQGGFVFRDFSLSDMWAYGNTMRTSLASGLSGKTDGAWRNITAVFSGGEASFYVNGVLAGAPSAVETNAALRTKPFDAGKSPRLSIGNTFTGGDPGNACYYGIIDEARFSSGVLSAARIRFDHDSVASPDFLSPAAAPTPSLRQLNIRRALSLGLGTLDPEADLYLTQSTPKTFAAAPVATTGEGVQVRLAGYEVAYAGGQTVRGEGGSFAYDPALGDAALTWLYDYDAIDGAVTVLNFDEDLGEVVLSTTPASALGEGGAVDFGATVTLEASGRQGGVMDGRFLRWDGDLPPGANATNRLLSYVQDTRRRTFAAIFTTVSTNGAGEAAEDVWIHDAASGTISDAAGWILPVASLSSDDRAVSVRRNTAPEGGEYLNLFKRVAVDGTNRYTITAMAESFPNMTNCLRVSFPGRFHGLRSFPGNAATVREWIGLDRSRVEVWPGQFSWNRRLPGGVDLAGLLPPSLRLLGDDPYRGSSVFGYDYCGVADLPSLVEAGSWSFVHSDVAEAHFGSRDLKGLYGDVFYDCPRLGAVTIAATNLCSFRTYPNVVHHQIPSGTFSLTPALTNLAFTAYPPTFDGSAQDALHQMLKMSRATCPTNAAAAGKAPLVIYCSKRIPAWLELASPLLGAEKAIRPPNCFGVWVDNDGQRRAFLVHRRSDYDGPPAGLVITVR